MQLFFNRIVSLMYCSIGIWKRTPAADWLTLGYGYTVEDTDK